MTAPELYTSARLFVILQTTFVALVAAPVLCLPCVYVWMVRRGLAGERERRDSPAVLRRAKVILDGMEVVQNEKLTGECCICMTDFCEADGAPSNNHGSGFDPPAKVTMPSSPGTITAASTFATDDGGCSPTTPDVIVRTVCGHMFHRDCLGLWLRSSPDCPLCRNYLEGKRSLERREEEPDRARQPERQNEPPHDTEELERPRRNFYGDPPIEEQGIEQVYSGDLYSAPPRDMGRREARSLPYTPLPDLEEGVEHSLR